MNALIGLEDKSQLALSSSGINSTLSHYVLRARSYVVIINTLFYKGILR